MAKAAPRPCTHPGCGVLVAEGGLCDQHRKQRQREVDARRETASRRLYTSAWRKARAGFLARHPLCECDECKQLDRVLPANVVDHIVPHRGDRALFWDRSNWQAMNARCHNRKTAREDGGFGNRRADHHPTGGV
ncbi:MAG: HNH endonuclease [Abyssibacter sp.]|uniref:HNH endonuclease n=1 Tax=Abyssibacter sp. TaxID=2320200 RepID=UPI00321BC9A8